MIASAFQWVYVALAVGFIIFIHELGHFLVAKKLGMNVERFAIGYGPPLVGFKRGGTEYCITWFPLIGGYVKIAGMELEPPEEKKDGEGGAEQDSEGQEEKEKQEAGEEKGFYTRPVAHRCAVLVAGSAATLVLALILYCVVPMVGTVEAPDYDQLYIADVSDPGAPFEIGDRIIGIAGRKVHKLHGVIMAIMLNPERDVTYTILRGGREMEFPYQGTADPETGELSGYSLVSGAFVGIVDGLPAREAGLRAGDRIVRIGGKDVSGWADIVETVQALPEGMPAEVVVVRGWEEMVFPVTPVIVSPGDTPKFGIVPYVVIQEGPLAAVGMGMKRFCRDAANLFTVLKMLVTRKLGMKGVMGPVGIIAYSKQVAQLGLGRFMALMAFITLNLTVLNLMPVPVLDGGHVVFQLIEGIRRRPVSIRAQMAATKVAYVLILLFFIVVLKNDVVRIASDFWMRKATGG